MGLSDPVINALLAFTLEVKKNTLPPKYVTMMAGILKRNDIKTSRGALEYLVNYEKELSENREVKSRRNLLSSSNQKTDKQPSSQSSDRMDEEEVKIDEEQAKANFKALFGG